MDFDDVDMSDASPDEFFTEVQIRRLKVLMIKMHGGGMSEEEQTELQALIEVELLASAKKGRCYGRCASVVSPK